MKNVRVCLLIVLIALVSICLCACDDNGSDTISTPKTYTIQYVDDGGTHTLSVSSGELFSLDSVPSRNGYEFLGLFDADEGGTQYVHANGSSISAFSDNKNLVLYPQFKAKEYTLVLDYGEAAVTGIRQIKVNYGQTISELPTNLTVENKNFAGWYTQADKKGTQIADRYGLIPQHSVLTEDVFDLSDARGFVYLYAGFTGEMHMVTFYYGSDPTPEEMQIEHGTYISEVITSKRVDGKASISWTKTNGGSDVFTGKIIADTVLYACEYAPVIDFDANGGRNVDPIIAKAGSSITLPTPTRENYKFAGWYTSSGSKYSATVMGTESVNLTARWNPMLIFNTNGGTTVDNVSAEVGTRITLPTTEKDGFMFAGWYTEQGQEYISTSMPQNSVKLVAKYWNVKSITKNIVSSDKYTTSWKQYVPSLDWYRSIDMSDLCYLGLSKVDVKGYVNLRYNGTSAGTTRRITIDFYSSNTISDSYLMSRHDFDVASDNYTRYSFSAIWDRIPETINACFYTPQGYFSGSYAYISDLYIIIEYPDMSILY